MMYVKKKTRFDFYKTVQAAGFQTQSLHDVLNLGLTLPPQEAGQVLDFINNLGSALKAIHDTISTQYQTAATPSSSTG